MTTTSSAFVRDVDAAAFERDVLTRSSEVPVVVDFWATWCGPCRVLGPILEKEIDAMAGKVELAKVDTDRDPELASRYNVQGIPAVKAFRNGQVVAEFVGARPATFIAGWLKELVPSPQVQELARAEQALLAGRVDEADSALEPLVDDPTVGSRAALLLARLRLDQQRSGDVPALLAKIDPRSEAADAIPSLERLLAFARDAAAYGGEEKARAAFEADAKDLEARHALASALAARGLWREALEQFLEIASRNRKFRDDGARLAMLAIFDHLGPEHELVQEYRRRLQIVL